VLNLKLSFTNDEVVILKVVLGIQSMVMSSDLVKNALVIAICNIHALGNGLGI